MRVIDEDTWFDWELDRVALQWMIKSDDWSSAWAKVRVHNDGPGPGEWHCNADVWVRDGIYQLVGFISKRDDSPLGSEHKALYSYLNSLGLRKKKHRRFKGSSVGASGAI